MGVASSGCNMSVTIVNDSEERQYEFDYDTTAATRGADVVRVFILKFQLEIQNLNLKIHCPCSAQC